jgi:glycerate kinase
MPGPILRERPVLVAPDSFKGTLRASEVAGAIGRGLERAGLMPPDLCPVADGGQGTTDALLPALGGEIVAAPLGRAVPGSFALLEDGDTALVEDTGAASSSYWMGELVCAAVDAGAKVILVAPDGSDDGAGALRAIAEHGGIGGARLVLLCHGDLRTQLWAAQGAVLEPGARWILDALGFDDRMRAARAVVTGEGRLDSHTLTGSVVGEIGQRTRQAGVPLHAVVGTADLDLFGRRMIDLQRVLEATTLEALEAAGEQLGSDLADGRA